MYNFCGLVVQVKIMCHEKCRSDVTHMHQQPTNHISNRLRHYDSHPLRRTYFGLISCTGVMSTFQVCISSCKAVNSFTVAQVVPLVWVVSQYVALATTFTLLQSILPQLEIKRSLMLQDQGRSSGFDSWWRQAFQFLLFHFMTSYFHG